MQRPNDNVRQAILLAAKRFFLAQGASKTTMRAIAQEAQVAVGSIYTYFPNKDAILKEVLAPALQAINNLFALHNGERYLSIEIYTDPARIVEMRNMLFHLVSQYRLELRLLFFGTAGTAFENYRMTLMAQQEQLSHEYMNLVKARYPKMHVEVSPFFIQLMCGLWLTVITELIAHEELSEAQLQQTLDEYTRYGLGGWRALLLPHSMQSDKVLPE